MYFKHSKDLTSLSSLKASSLAHNRDQLDITSRQLSFYSSQPPRTHCITCKSPLKPSPDITIRGIPYHVCDVCSHFNGGFLDTTAFSEYVYQKEGSADFASQYLSDYKSRCEHIYLPKLKFLLDCLQSEDFVPTSLVDFGCGAGHFVCVCNEYGIDASGFDLSPQLIEAASKHYSSLNMPRNSIPFALIQDESQLHSALSSVDCDVVSALFLLEHLHDPSDFVRNFVQSNARYLYASIPLLSLSTFLDAAHPSIYPRQLSNGHTHLYTPESLDYLREKAGLRLVGSWSFGADALDLRRSLHVSIEQAGCSDSFKSLFLERYMPLDLVNKLQAAIDTSTGSSELHFIWSK